MEEQNSLAGEKVPSVPSEEQSGFQKFLHIWKEFWRWVFHLRSVILVIPVAVIAILLSAYNEAHLPELVGINIQESGEYAQIISREVAVYGPLALTGVCLLLTLLSRRILYPWLVSVFTLVLPIFILFTNNFPN